MKTSTLRSMIVVAALAVAAGTVSAQTMNVRIPMSFRAGDTGMAAGDYQVHLASGISGVPVVYLRNAETLKSVILMPPVRSDAPKAWLQDGTPRLSFTCADSSCTLTKMWNGDGGTAYGFNTPKLPSIQARDLTTITLAMVKAH
ncbi:MAG TPA: hypothetical protein VG456_26455 [Candidatus Sulfopaludibacter sp.]|jgi:hypothetical protein|nr:hypothetical protein [Candidatus Sulfopaludibacter sp.]